MKYVIAFDITNDRKRYRAVKILLQYAYRVQKSVFEGYFSKDSIMECAQKLKDIIDGKTDSIRCYPLCKDCETKAVVTGNGVTVEEVAYIII